MKRFTESNEHSIEKKSKIYNDGCYCNRNNPEPMTSCIKKNNLNWRVTNSCRRADMKYNNNLSHNEKISNYNLIFITMRMTSFDPLKITIGNKLFTFVDGLITVRCYNCLTRLGGNIMFLPSGLSYEILFYKNLTEEDIIKIYWCTTLDLKKRANTANEKLQRYENYLTTFKEMGIFSKKHECCYNPIYYNTTQYKNSVDLPIKGKTCFITVNDHFIGCSGNGYYMLFNNIDTRIRNDYKVLKNTIGCSITSQYAIVLDEKPVNYEFLPLEISLVIFMYLFNTNEFSNLPVLNESVSEI